MNEKKVNTKITKSIILPYNNDGFFTYQAEENATITFEVSSREFKHGVMLGLVGLCGASIDDCNCADIHEFVNDSEWFWDTTLTELLEILDQTNSLHKHYIVHFENLEEDGVFIATDNIIEFISGVASCPIAFGNTSSQHWSTLKYLDLECITTINKIKEELEESECFNLCAINLKDRLNIRSITIKK